MNRRKFLASSAMAAVLPLPQQRYRISGYTENSYGSEVIDAGMWRRVRAHGARGNLKQITSWVHCEPLSFTDPSPLGECPTD